MERLIHNTGKNMDERFDKNDEGNRFDLYNFHDNRSFQPGKASGCIVDTSALFSSGPASTTEVRQRLIKACIGAFKRNYMSPLSSPCT
jgi:polyribonucleotide 5'-hydroxyl-kinase